MLFPDYIEQVLLDYRRKRDDNKLPLGLVMPSPAELKKECLKACTHRYHTRDERTLTAFFDKGDSRETCLKAIERFEIDRFRPLANYLRGSTDTTNHKNIELLAWLIDFRGRPYDSSRPLFDMGADTIDGDRDADVMEEGVPRQQEEEGLPPVSTRHRNFKFRAGLIGAVVTIFVVVGIVVVPIGGRPHFPALRPASEAGQCMYWADDHYEQIPCDQKPENGTVVPLDSERFVDLRRITDPDTITLASIGKVWYFKRRGGDIEYFTFGGDYPVDPTYRLLPLTGYMIRKHIHP
jgi:hypothetical protein